MTGGRVWGALFFLFMTFASFSAVKTDIDGHGFLDNDFQAPGLELLRHPVFGVVEHVGTYDTTADVAGDVGSVVHGTVVRTAEFKDFPGHLILGTEGQHRHDGNCQGEK